MKRFNRAISYYGRATIRKWGFSLIILAVSVTLSFISAYRYQLPSNADRLELLRLPLLFSTRGARPTPDDIVIAAIDGVSVSELANGARVFPRKYGALALKKIGDANPRAIILDLRAAKDLSDPEANDLLEEALRSGPTSILASEVYTEGATFCGRRITFSPSQSDPRFLAAAKMQIPMNTLETYGNRMKISACDDPSTTLAQRLPLSRPLSELGGFEIKSPGLRDLINFYGPPGTIQKISLATILRESPAVLRKLFEKKVVLMGFIYDENRGMQSNESFSVPVDTVNRMFGVEIHATIAANLLDRSWIHRWSLQTECLFVCLSVLVMTGIALKLAPEKGIPFIIVFVGLIYLVSYIAFIKFNFLIPGVTLVWEAAELTVLASGIVHYRYIKMKLIDQLKRFGIKQ